MQSEMITIEELTAEVPLVFTKELQMHLNNKVLTVITTFNTLLERMGITHNDWITLPQQVEIVPVMLLTHPNTFNLVVRLINIHNATLAQRTRVYVNRN